MWSPVLAHQPRVASYSTSTSARTAVPTNGTTAQNPVPTAPPYIRIPCVKTPSTPGAPPGKDPFEDIPAFPADKRLKYCCSRECCDAAIHAAREQANGASRELPEFGQPSMDHATKGLLNSRLTSALQDLQRVTRTHPRRCESRRLEEQRPRRARRGVLVSNEYVLMGLMGRPRSARPEGLARRE